MTNISVADHAKSLIERSGMTYQQIADGSGTSKATISRLMRGDGVQADTVDRIVAFLRPFEDGGSPPIPENISREALEVIIRQHHEQLSALRVSHAAHLATVKKVARQRLVWAVIEAILLLAVIGWFIWDLTHPEVGLIRLKQSGHIVGQLLGLAGR